MAISTLISLIAAAIFLVGCIQIAGACNYSSCVFSGTSRSSPMEHLVMKLNIDQIPNNAEETCPSMLNRSNVCRPFFEGCPTAVSLPYSDRWNDSVYVKYINDFGDVACANVSKYLPLKVCLNPTLLTRLKGCLFNQGSSGYNLTCLRNRYTHSHNPTRCSNETTTVFLDLVNNWFAKNPYFLTTNIP